MIKVLHARADGTFVIERGGYPYHVTHDDPMHSEVAAAAAVGLDLPPEPAPVMVAVSQPTRAELMAQLLRIQAQIEALPED